MILIAQSSRSARNGELAQRLTESGYPVLLANSTGEAFRIATHMRPDVVVLDSPPVQRCPFVLCSLLRVAMDAPPRLVALVDIPDPDARARCQECMALLPPDASAREVAGAVEAVVGREQMAAGTAFSCCSRRS